MNRTSIWVLFALFGISATATPGQDLPTRTIDFTYRVRLTDIPDDAKLIKIWIPLLQSTDAQSVSNISIDSSCAFRIVTEPKYGNQFALLEVPNDGSEPSLSASYRITRSTRMGLSQKQREEPASREYLKQFLSPSRFVALHGPIAKEAQKVAGGAKDPLEIARKLYDNIVDTVRYDKSGQGWGRGDSLYACDVRAGNCTDFHSLFIGEARSLGLPARFVMGFSVPNDADAGTIAGYHCWAEFYTPDYGWVPIDASDAFKYPERRDFLFGALDENRVRFTSGRDIKLPGMAGEALNYSIYPYAEIDGKVHTGMETEYLYANAD